MKLITYECNGKPRVGACVDGGRYVDLAEAARQRGVQGEPFRSMLELIVAGDEALECARRLLADAPASAIAKMAGICLLAPLPVPEQIRDFANYELHVRQALRSTMQLRAQTGADPQAEFRRLAASGMYDIPPVWYERPLYYKANRFSVTGHDHDVIWPAYALKMDYELELAVVIGRRTKDATRAQARAAIFGYTIYNDFSARDVQAQESQFRMGPAKGKDFDTGNAIGPCIVTADELPDIAPLVMSVRVNGVEKGRALAGSMQHDVIDTICFVSQSETLYPGEILAMGTVGNGCGYETLSFLSPGDIVELEIEGIGVLRNQLVRTAPASGNAGRDDA